jgi:UDP-N-acetylmuramyl pentapeptide phosphotransferase/UDP-N-acetylglucosamine-1-phosphate transferase
MTVLVAFVVGFLAGRLVWVLLRSSWHETALTRENFRGRVVPNAGGIALVLGVAVVEGGRAVAGALKIGTAAGLTSVRAATVIAVAGFAFFGLLDDLVGSGQARGFRGHVAELFRGRLTTGGAKLVGGMAVSLVAVGTLRPGAGAGRLLLDAALVALTANLANLFDLAPGRVGKVSLLAGAALVAVRLAAPELTALAVVLGCVLALLLDDLHERVMLGDTGANAVGAALGVALVATCSPATRTIALGVVLAANVLSELVSFSRIIEAVPPLRAFDRAGRLP